MQHDGAAQVVERESTGRISRQLSRRSTKGSHARQHSLERNCRRQARQESGRHFAHRLLLGAIGYTGKQSACARG